MMDSSDIERMLVEIVTGKPPTLSGPEADAMRAQLKMECDEILAKGGIVAIPHEIPFSRDDGPEPAQYDADFEDKHPRDDGGKFSGKGEGATAKDKEEAVNDMVARLNLTREQAKTVVDEIKMIELRLNPEKVEPTEAEVKNVEVGKRYPGQCFTEAGRYALSHRAVSPVLVHGTISNPDGRVVAHGWVELPGNKVFDATNGEFYDKAWYYKAMNAQAEKTYSAEEMWSAMEKSRNWGPWHATKGVYNKLPSKGKKGKR